MDNLTRSPFRCIIEHRSASGQLLKRSSFIPNSVVQAYIGILSVQFRGSTILLKGVSGSNYNCNSHASNLNILSPQNDDSYGIVVGSGTDAVTINDYKLQSQIMQGIGANLLQHSVVDTPILFDVTSTKAQSAFRRFFTNLSGSSITINEIGIYCNAYGSIKYCIERTLYNAVLANEEALSVTYLLEKEIS